MTTAEQALACTTAIERIVDAFVATAPDVVVIMDNDEDEMFLDDVRPAITVFTGATGRTSSWSSSMTGSSTGSSWRRNSL